MQDLFTVPEVNLMCIFDTSHRETLIAQLGDAIDDFDTGDAESDAEMVELAELALKKLAKLSDEDFYALKLDPIYEEYD